MLHVGFDVIVGDRLVRLFVTFRRPEVNGALNALQIADARAHLCRLASPPIGRYRD